MELHDPVVVYEAATNVEAQIVKLLLADAGIEAFAAEDLSVAGLWMFGLLPGIHKPQIWVSRANVEAARPILEGFEQQAAERRRARTEVDARRDAPIRVVCEDCGKASSFPSVQRGSIQDCPHCGAYVDVLDASDAPGGHEGEEDEG